MELNNEVSSDVARTTAEELIEGKVVQSEEPGTSAVVDELMDTSMPDSVANLTGSGISDNQDVGIHDEMNAIFGEDPSPEVSAGQEESTVSEPADGDGVVNSEPKNDEPLPKSDLNQTPDVSNLEDMMEAMHADKVESPQAHQKQAETTGLELKDVLEALTGDLEESSNDGGDKPKKKTEMKTVKRRTEVEVLRDTAIESDSSAERTLRNRSRHNKTPIKAVDSKKTATGSKNKPEKKSKDRKTSESEEGEGSSDGEEKSQSKRRSSRPYKKNRTETDESEENSSDEEDSKPKKPMTRKSLRKSDDAKDQEKETSKTPRRKPGPKSARTKSTEGDSESDEERSPDQKSSKARKGRKPLPGTDLVSKSNKVCIITDCRQQCFPQLGISLHRFPVAPSSIRKFWLKLVNHQPPGPTTAYICSKHFTENDYNYDAKKDPTDTFYRKLKPGAIPSVGIPVSDKMYQKVKADVEVWKKTEMKAATESRKKKPGRPPQDKSGVPEVKTEPASADSQEEEIAAENKGNSSSSAPSKTASAKPAKDHGEDTKKGVAKGAPEKAKNNTSRSPSPSSVTLQGRTPGTNCSVPCCGNNLFETRAEGLNISYYRFPFDNNLAERWIKKIGDPRLNARTARICSDHFADKDFDGTGGGKRNLKPKAVPSLYLAERKPRGRESDEEDEEEEEKTASRKRSKLKAGGTKKVKPDTSFISMPLPIIEDIKSEPPSDDEVVGQDYAPSDPGSEPEETVPAKKIRLEKVGSKDVCEKDDDDTTDKENNVKRPRGRPRKDSTSSVSSKIKTVSLASLALPVVALERLGQRVIDAADSGSLRVRIKESDKAPKSGPRPKPGPKSKRKRVDSDIESSPANRVATRPGPLSKKKMLEKLDNTSGPKRFVAGPRKKLLRTSDNESESDVDNPPSPLSTAENDIPETPVTIKKTPTPVKVKLAELPKFLQDKSITEGILSDDGQIGDDMIFEEPPVDDLDSILDSVKSDKEKIIQLVKQRISEHTKIIEGKTMGAQQLADHNKILQGSALVLKKLAEKSGKPANVIPLSVADSSSATPSRTVLLKKVSDPIKLGLKPPSGRIPISKDSSPSSPSKTPVTAVSPLNSAISTPSRVSKAALGDDSGDSKASSALEKIRDYDNLMKKYLSAVLDKNVMSKKYTECKEAQKALEIKLNERNKELELAKRKISTLQAKINRTNSALEYFLTPNQIKLALQETKKVAWSPEEMLTAFTIKHLSKACYLFLRHKLNYPLPGISSLQRWMTMLSKDKTEDDEDNLADEDVSDKEESQEILEEGPGVVNEITGTLEEINACGAPGEENYQPEEAGENVKDSNQSSPFQVVFENDGNSNSNRKVIILKKMPKDGNGKMKMKSKLQISASENDVNVSNIEENDDKNSLYKLLPGAKTISMASSPLGFQKRRFVVPKNIKEKEKVSFQRLPQVRKDVSIPKPPRIQIVKNEPQEEYVHQPYDDGVDPNSESHMMQVAASDLVETVVKPEMVTHVTEDQQQGESSQKFFTISDLNSTQMEEHIGENVEHMTEDGQIVQKMDGEGEVMHETLISGDGMQSITIVKEGDVVEHHSGQAIEGMVAMAGDQQITFATTEDIGRAHQFAQIAYAQGNHGEITLHEDINNMTAVVINDIDEEQLNTLLMSNVVEQKAVEIQGEQAYGHKKIVYQTIDHDKNDIVLQPDSQAFIEEDEGTSGGAPRVYIINDEGHIVSTPGSDTAALAQEIGFIDSSAFAEIQSLGYKLSGDPDQSYTIGNLIENYAIASPTKPPKKS
uniref:THAP-type domain-containing protein n=1 Tax=Lygus hesperus TaxID=30085 RepID=A0A0K8T297_LYGHE